VKIRLGSEGSQIFPSDLNSFLFNFGALTITAVSDGNCCFPKINLVGGGYWVMIVGQVKTCDRNEFHKCRIQLLVTSYVLYVCIHTYVLKS
jgi:hypothetical protein